MTDRLDEAKRLHAETTSGEWNARADIDNDCEGFKRLYAKYGFGCTLIADGLRSCDRDSIIALHSIAPDLFALAEAAEAYIKERDASIRSAEHSGLHLPSLEIRAAIEDRAEMSLRAAVDRVRGV